MSFFYMMDDLRYLFFSFFPLFFLSFAVVVVVGLARDGCLVRSWLFGHAVGLAVAQRGCWELLQKQPQHIASSECWGLLLK